MREISRLAENRLASEDGLCSMDYISRLNPKLFLTHWRSEKYIYERVVRKIYPDHRRHLEEYRMV